MECRLSELRSKEVINIRTGRRLGYVCDAFIEAESGRILSLILPGPFRFFGLFGRGEEIVIPWGCICRMGDDLILVETECGEGHPPRGK